MKKDWKTLEMEKLAEAFLLLKNKEELLAFLRDICTISELEEMSKRLEAAKLLKAGKSIRTVAENLGISTTTASRVARWKNAGEGGYQTVLSRLS